MRNITDDLQSTLGGNRVEIVRQIASTCGALSCNAYIVGGVVRDALLGIPTTDLDISVVSPSPLSLRHIADSLSGAVIKVSQFGTIKVELDGVIIDFVSARSERYRSPGKLPEVTPGTLREDLARRDFTINSMAVSLDHSDWGKLIDPHHGQHDIARKIVRTLHEQSFPDDPTRILRAARYASRFGFSLDNRTKDQLLTSTGYLDSISPERFKRELEHVFNEPNAITAIKLLSAWGALDLPGEKFSFDEYAWSKLKGIASVELGERRLISWALISLGFGASRSDQIMDQWRLDDDSRTVSSDTSRLRYQLANTTLSELSNSAQVALLENFDLHAIKAVSLSGSQHLARNVLTDYLQHLVNVRPISNGHDLIALGVPNGPLVGEVLHMLKIARLDGNVSSRSEETLFIQCFVSNLTH